MKLAILVAALVALCSIAAFAAETWKQDGDNWYCYDSDGNMIYGEWKKSGSNYYYLDAGTGAMVKNQLIDSGDYKYYVGADGARVLGQWVKVPVENNDDGWEYMYFQAVSGKAVINKAQTINSKKYQFNADGYMLYGYMDNNWSTVDYPSLATYYYGPKTDGSAQTGWVNITDGSDGGHSDESSVYFYFNKGVKKADTTTTINSKKYTFADDGAMYYGWKQVTTASTASASAYVESWAYFGEASDGVIKKSQWIKSTKDFGDGEDGDTAYWYYVGSNAARYHDAVKKINGKYYLFDQYAHMKAGIRIGTFTGDKLSPLNFVYLTYPDTVDAYKVFDDNLTEEQLNATAIMYFSADGDTDGSMKTGVQTVTIDGDTVSVYFDKHGYAVEGVSSKKIYKNGVLQSAGSDKVAVKKLRVTDTSYNGFNKYFLVNSSGSILKNTKQVDADGIYWVTNGDYATAGDYKIYKVVDKDYSSYAATAVRSGKVDGGSFTASGTTYYLHFDNSTAASGYITVDFSTSAN